MSKMMTGKIIVAGNTAQYGKINTSKTTATLTTLTTLAHRLPPFHRAWTQIFRGSNQPACEIAIELCCGQSPKTGIAIYESSLANHVGYVDMSHSALKICRQLVNNIAPDCSSFFLNSSLATLNHDLPFNLVTGNHIFDDLLIQYFLEHVDTSKATAYQNKRHFVSLIHDVVGYYREDGDYFLSELAAQLARQVANNGRIIFSDYSSYYERSYGIVDWPQLRFSLADELGRHLSRKGFHSITIDSIPTLFDRVHIWEKR